MIVGILKEIKAEENRVSMTPAGVEVMKQHGHTVLVEKDAGIGSGFNNTDYRAAGAKIAKSASGSLRQSGDGHARQRAASTRIRPDPGGPDRIHLPPSGRCQGIDADIEEAAQHQHCLRNHSEIRRIATAPDPHERSGRDAWPSSKGRCTWK